MTPAQKALEALRRLEALADKSEKLDGLRMLGGWAVAHLSAIRSALEAEQAQAAQAVPAEPVAAEWPSKADVLRHGKATGIVEWVSECGEFFTFAEHQEMSERLAQFARSLLASAPQPVAVQPLTEEQFKVEWHRRTGRICGTDLSLLLRAKYVTEAAHGIGAASPKDQA